MLKKDNNEIILRKNRGNSRKKIKTENRQEIELIPQEKENNNLTNNEIEKKKKKKFTSFI